MKRAHLACLLLTAATFVAVALAYHRLPDPMPTHWNGRGQADGWTPLPWGALLLPLLTLGVWGLLALLPAISPRGFRLEPFRATYARLLVLLVGFFALLDGVVLARAISGRSDLARLMPLLLGALLLGVGNYLGKTTPNFFVGIHTPWTLASPEVWRRTHRLGGWLFVGAGLVLLVLGALGEHAGYVVAVVLVAALVPAAYSFVLYRRLDGLGSEDEEPPHGPPAPRAP
jgi:uncharacterized membrane protein